MKVNVISESAFTVQGHGVHTAFTETVEALRKYTECDVAENTARPADVVHLHTVGPYSLHKLLFGSGKKVVSAHVTPDSFVGSLVGAQYWRPLAKAYLRWFYNRADGVLAVSNEVVDELRAMKVHKPVFLAPNTIDLDVFHTTKSRKEAARKELGISADAFVVIGSGQVQPRKRIDTFVATAEAVPKATFIWVGGIPFKKAAAESAQMERIMANPPKNVRFPGLMKREETVAYFRAADMFFLPSIQETFGIVIVEAAAAGLPVLLRDLEQYRKTFGDGYERGDEGSFAKVVERFRTDAGYYAQWQEAAKKIAQRYDAKTGAERLLEVYNAVLSATKS